MVRKIRNTGFEFESFPFVGCRNIGYIIRRNLTENPIRIFFAFGWIVIGIGELRRNISQLDARQEILITDSCSRFDVVKRYEFYFVTFNIGGFRFQILRIRNRGIRENIPDEIFIFIKECFAQAPIEHRFETIR